jgi:hypothetical protein
LRTLRFLFGSPGTLGGMTTRKQKAALALTGAVALASGAYALGTQVDDGSASATGNRPERGVFIHHEGPGRPFGLEGLADRLGVDEDKLRTALEGIRSAMPAPGDRRDDLAKALADELGTTQARVEAALDRVHKRFEQEMKDRHDALAEELAKRLNLDVSKVKKALEAPMRFRFHHP